MAHRVCEECGVGFDQFGRGRPAKRCPEHRDRYGAAHRRTRAATVDQAIGRLCVRCGQVIRPGQAVHLDHRDDGDGYAGYSHASCNVRAGTVARNKAVAAVYRAAKGLEQAPGSTPATVEKTPQRSLNREPPPPPTCQRTAAQIDTSAAAGDPLPCICARRNSRCW